MSSMLLTPPRIESDGTSATALFEMIDKVISEKRFLSILSRMITLTSVDPLAETSSRLGMLVENSSEPSKSTKMFSLAMELVGVVAKSKHWGDQGHDLMELYHALLEKLAPECRPFEDIIDGVFKRTIRFLRDEFLRLADLCDSNEFPIALRMQIAKQYPETCALAKRKDFLDNLLSSLDDLKSELESWDVVKRASFLGSFIQNNDTLILLGISVSLIELIVHLVKAKRMNHIKVTIILPSLETDLDISDIMSKLRQLCQTEIEWTIVNYRCLSILCQNRGQQKVLLSAKTVFKDGSFRCPAGARMLCTLASAYNIPILMVSSLHKLCSRNPGSDFRLESEFHALSARTNQLYSTKNEYYENQGHSGGILVNSFDLVPSDLVSYVLCNIGLVSPKRIYSTASDAFCKFESFLKQ